ncbi:GATA zinc finger-domain-containing protein [Cunninghamella echinulata]|nr:GATA zinc finger-domain-containing protein [Cunninghamella echinulata]
MDKRSMVGQRCHSCHTTETPEWRRGPDGARTLCNACGLHYSKLLRKESLSTSSQKLITSTAAPPSHSITQQSITTLPPSATISTNHTIPISTTTSTMPSSYPFMITTHHQHLHHHHHLSPHPTPLHLLNHSTTSSSPSSTSPSLSSSSSSNFSIVHQHHPNYN